MFGCSDDYHWIGRQAVCLPDCAASASQIKDMVSIRERPAAVEDRAVPGHWEGDLLSGSRNSYIATLVERHTRYVMLMKIANKDTQTVIRALIKQAKTLPNELYKPLTWDRGKTWRTTGA
jgi:IS30 family transposase